MNSVEQTIFVCDANENDWVLLKQVFEKTKLPFKIIFFKKGEELLIQLQEYFTKKQSLPRMILLDLDTQQPPSGLEILKSIKSHFLFRVIPILVVSSDAKDEYIVEAYSLGANSFIVKPANLQQFEDFVNTLNTYWFKFAKLPAKII